jgi:hypothetical protein
MLHTVTSSYRELARLVPGLVGRLSSAVRNKKILLEMAGKRLPKPSRKTKLGNVLSNYTRKSCRCYDPQFNKQIRKLAPNWFVTSSDILKENKRKIFDIAIKKLPKPQFNTKLGRALYYYTLKTYSCYDPEFDREVRRLAPHWFVTQFEAAKHKKSKLLTMARKKTSRPNQKTKLGMSLSSYTQKKSGCYDPEFDREVRRLAPHWFVTRSEMADQKKLKIIKIASKKLPKPSLKTEIGKAFCIYTLKTSDCYDPKFTKHIKKISPNWFVKTSDHNKRQLICMAGKKMLKPKINTKLGMRLYSYTKKTSRCYDAEFTKQIKRLMPNWLVRTSETNKRQLLKMARSKMAKPPTKTKLEHAFYNYTIKTSKTYDPAFTKQIKKLAPHWFKRCSTR